VDITEKEISSHLLDLNSTFRYPMIVFTQFKINPGIALDGPRVATLQLKK
jgi:hypothetical protein